MSPRAKTAATDPLDAMHPAVAAWFRAQLGEPTEVQSRGWASIAKGGHTLLCAPTGSGKTLAAFLWGISELAKRPLPEAKSRMRLLYISPLRALNYDIDRNLRAPLAGLAMQAMQLGTPVPDLAVGVRTGDTSQRERAQQRRNPPDIFITTPESLYVMLTTGARELFDSVETVIIDEVHALAQSKRGTHLALSLERLAQRVADANDGRVLQRIAVSATQKPIERIAAFMGGVGTDVDIVQTVPNKVYDLEVRVPVEDMTALGVPSCIACIARPASGARRLRSMS
jgi:ATP-dependent Lhr-like helicase